MTVAEVWGRIQGHDATLVAQEGDKWTFSVPPWVTGPIIAEIWAKDDAGNISYRAGIFSITEGTIKCIRWLTTNGICTMRAVERAEITMSAEGRDITERIPERPMASIGCARALCDVEGHICAKIEG